MKESHKCLSFSSEKVRIFYEQGVVHKLTNQNEYNTHIKALDYFSDLKNTSLPSGLEVRVTPVVEFDGETLTTVLCNGDNLEILLRSSLRRNKAMEVMRDLIFFLRQVNFFWGDIAPRNLILDLERKVLWMLDFEKQTYFDFQDRSQNSWVRHLHKYALEEISCFCLRKEKENVLSFPSNFMISGFSESINEIHSTRKKMLLNAIFGEQDSYLIEHVLLVEKMMSEVAYPIFLGDKIKSSMDDVEEKIRKKGPNWYVKHVLKTSENNGKFNSSKIKD